MTGFLPIEDVRPGDVVPMLGLVTEVVHHGTWPMTGEPYLPEAELVAVELDRCPAQWWTYRQPFGAEVPVQPTRRTRTDG